MSLDFYDPNNPNIYIFIVFQSSVTTFHTTTCGVSGVGTVPLQVSYQRPTGILMCLKNIIQYEGVPALFRGLGPMLIGIAPSRAIYFSFYATAKNKFNRSGWMVPESKTVHMLSACSAGKYYVRPDCKSRVT